jgi:hypothetical protein
MKFQQPNSLSRVMSLILDQLGPDRVLTLEFANGQEAERSLEVLNELAIERQIGVMAIPLREHIVELRLAYEAA